MKVIFLNIGSAYLKPDIVSSKWLMETLLPTDIMAQAKAWGSSDQGDIIATHISMVTTKKASGE